MTNVVKSNLDNRLFQLLGAMAIMQMEAQAGDPEVLAFMQEVSILPASFASAMLIQEIPEEEGIELVRAAYQQVKEIVGEVYTQRLQGGVALG